MGESRKQFEAWLMEKFGYREDYLDYWRGDGDFKHHPVLRARFEGWHASREAIEIKLPEVIDAQPLGPDSAKMICAFHKNVVGECAKSIRAAGIKVKGA